MKNMATPTMSHHDVYMRSDKYLNEPDKIKEMEGWGADIIPVDLNNGFVATDKNAEGNLKKTEENLGDRFSLGK